MQISRTSLSCSLHMKIYGTEPIGGTFDADGSPAASTPYRPTTSVFLFLYILCLRSCRLPSVFIRRPCLPSLPEELQTVGFLRSLGVTPVHRYCKPFRHLLAFLPFPGLAGYRSDLLQSISLWDEEGFSSCLTCPCTVLSLPPRRSVMSSVSPRHVMLPSPRSRE